MSFINQFFLLLTCVILIPVGVLALQVIFAHIARKSDHIEEDTPCKMAVLIPAHNESSIILKTIGSIKAHTHTGDRVIVIADNCTDDTADVARESGVEVIERHNEHNRGKGFALDFGINHLKQNPPDVVVVVDADCTVEKGSLRNLAIKSHSFSRPVQALYLMLTLPEATLKSKISQFAWLVKNHVRPLGYSYFGLPCPLMGSGMAFPWQQIISVDLASGNLVEDVKLGIDLAKQGNTASFYPDLLVTSYFPLNSEAQATQRKRWEHGHLNMIFVEAPKLLITSFFRFDFRLFAMSLDLMVPPIALLVMAILGLLLFIVIFYLFALVKPLVLLLLLFGIIMLILSIIAAWSGWAKTVLPFSAFLMMPIYVLNKIPTYFSFLVKRQKKWVRTERDKSN